MRRMRQAAKTDDNQPDIVKALRDAGAWVQPIHQPYDLLVWFRGLWHVLEVKDGDKPPSQQFLTPDQLKTLAALRCSGVKLVRDINEAFAAIGLKTWQE